MVAAKHSGDDFKLGIITCTDQLPRVNVKILFYSQVTEPLIHCNSFWLLFCDEPQPLHKQSNREEAKVLNEKVWSQLPLNLWLEERKALQQQHEQMITPGVHLDRPAIGIGYPSAYVVSDLLSEGLEIAGRVIDPPSDIVQSELGFLRY